MSKQTNKQTNKQINKIALHFVALLSTYPHSFIFVDKADDLNVEKEASCLTTDPDVEDHDQGTHSSKGQNCALEREKGASLSDWNWIRAIEASMDVVR